MNTQSTSDTEMERRFKHYIFFFIGQIFSLLGSVVVSFSITWYIVEETGSPLFLSIALGFIYLPRIITILFAGVITDLANRKKVIFYADFIQMITTVIVILFFMNGFRNIWLLIAMNSLRGLFQVFHRMAANAIIPVMVPQKRLSRINGINSFVNGITWIAGPFIGAILLINFTIEQILWVDLVTFIIALIPLLIIKIPSVIDEKPRTEKENILTEFKSGFKTMKETPGLLVLSIWAGIINTISLPFGLLLPVFIYGEPHVGSEFHYALVNGYYFVGVLLGSLLMSIRKKWKNKQTYILVTCTIVFASILITSLAAPGDFITMGIGRIIYGFNISIATALYYTILQMIVTPEQQGRILSIDEMISFGVYPIVMFLTGFLTINIEIVILFIILAITGMAFNIGMLFTKFRSINFDTISDDTQETDSI